MDNAELAYNLGAYAMVTGIIEMIKDGYDLDVIKFNLDEVRVECEKALPPQMVEAVSKISEEEVKNGRS